MRLKFNTLHHATESPVFTQWRQVLVLRLLLGSLSLLATAALIASVASLYTPHHHTQSVASIEVNLIFVVATLGLFIVTRRGHYLFGAYAVIGLLWVSTIILTLLWSFELPIACLMAGLTIVLVGTLLEPRAALKMSIAIILSIVAVGSVEILNLWTINLDWTPSILDSDDLTGLIVILAVTTLVSNISNRIMNQALAAARKSELELAAERDGLERNVVARTAELERVQVERIMQLQRLSEFGHLTSGIIHDLASPLTAASLSVQLLHESTERSELLEHAVTSLRHLEAYLGAARHQLNGELSSQNFDATAAVKQVLEMVSHRAIAAGVTLELRSTPVSIYGNSVKFHQLAANLITNAIDSYLEQPYQLNRQVIINLSQHGQEIRFSVADHGVGVPPEQHHRIFEQFVTTKSRSSGTGLGLMLAKQVVEHDFNGTLTLSSTHESGTIFTAVLHCPAQKKPPQRAAGYVLEGVDTVSVSKLNGVKLS